MVLNSIPDVYELTPVSVRLLRNNAVAAARRASERELLDIQKDPGPQREKAQDRSLQGGKAEATQRKAKTITRMF